MDTIHLITITIHLFDTIQYNSIQHNIILIRLVDLIFYPERQAIHFVIMLFRVFDTINFLHVIG